MTQNAINNKASEFTIDPLGAADSYLQFSESTTGKFRMGNDATNDSYRISIGSALGTSDAFVMTSAGEKTMPLQPGFFCGLTTTVVNVTGNANDYTLIFDNEMFDTNGDFNLGTGVFTAPVTGTYMFTARPVMGATLAACTIISSFLLTSNRTYFGFISNAATRATAAGVFAVLIDSLADMDAADTAAVHVQGFNQGGDNVDFLGTSSGAGSRLAGVLVV